MAATLFRKPQSKKLEDGNPHRWLSKNWYGRFRVPTTDRHSKPVVRCLRTADKEIAKKRLRRLEREFAAGEANPYREQHERPLSDHVKDYEQWLWAKGSAASHAAKQPRRIRAIFTTCRFAYGPDIQPDRFERALADLAGGKSTRNAYFVACKAFLNWLVRNGRAGSNPLRHVGRVKVTDSDDSRPLEDDELRCLLETTLKQPTRKGMTAGERWVAYRLAVETGFRANEIRTLTWGCVDLDGKPPVARVLSAYSKNRERADQPLSATTVAMLAGWQAESGNPPQDARRAAVFPRGPRQGLPGRS